MSDLFKIPFNRPFLTGDETRYIEQAVRQGQISGNGKFTKKCHEFFETRYAAKKTLLTSSCTDALELAAMLTNVGPGDQVILPSFTFVSTANAFILRGAELVFADSCSDTPHISPESIESLITSRTKVIVVVHYGGVACDMDSIMHLARKHNLFVVEDAAHAIESFHFGRPLGTIGDLGTFSFHETKNIISGEGGLLVINNPEMIERAEILWEKGTNRAAFARGEVAKYSWIDIGSSFLASEITAAFLYAQLENITRIQEKRKALWYAYANYFNQYSPSLAPPHVPEYATVNGHIFYALISAQDLRHSLITYLSRFGIQALFHYLPLHSSPYFKSKYSGSALTNAERYAKCLLRFPIYYSLTESQIEEICQHIGTFVDQGNTARTF